MRSILWFKLERILQSAFFPRRQYPPGRNRNGGIGILGCNRLDQFPVMYCKRWMNRRTTDNELHKAYEPYRRQLQRLKLCSVCQTTYLSGPSSIARSRTITCVIESLKFQYTVPRPRPISVLKALRSFSLESSCSLLSNPINKKRQLSKSLHEGDDDDDMDEEEFAVRISWIHL